MTLVEEILDLIGALESAISVDNFFYSEECDQRFKHGDWTGITTSEYILCKNEKLELVFTVFDFNVSYPVLARNGKPLGRSDDLPREIIINLDQIELTFEDDVIDKQGGWRVRF